MNSNLILIGYMGSGKSTIGKQLAKKYQYDFLDTDEWIEHENGMTIKELFASKGENYFRNLETQALISFQNQIGHTILSTGGGMALSATNARLLRNLGIVILLKVSKEVVIQRLQGDTTRPLLQGEDFEKKIEQMLEQRDPLYESAAHYVIDTDGKTIEEVIEEIGVILVSVRKGERME